MQHRAAQRPPRARAPASASAAAPSGGPRGKLPQTRAVHITGAAWDYKPKHDAVMALLKDHRINAVEVDLKDESGIVNYASNVPLATTVGAIDKYYDLKAMIAEVHARRWPGDRPGGRLPRQQAGQVVMDQRAQG